MFCVRISCSDCTGQDEHGCGDGKPWWLDDPHNPGERGLFATKEDAHRAIEDHRGRLSGQWIAETVAVTNVDALCYAAGMLLDLAHDIAATARGKMGNNHADEEPLITVDVGRGRAFARAVARYGVVMSHIAGQGR